MLPEFEKLSLHDQTSLLRRSILEMILLRNVITFDFENSVCHSAEKNFPEKYPEIYVSSRKTFTNTGWLI